MPRRPYRIPALLLIAAAASLAAVPPAAAQAGSLVPPRLLNENEIEQQIHAAFPPAQRDSGRSGSVTLYFMVWEDGTVDPASISVRGASSTAFVAPATALVPAMRFVPARAGGRSVPAWIAHTVFFENRGATPPVAREPQPDEGTYDLSAVSEPPAILDRAAMARQIDLRFPSALLDKGVSGGAIVRFRIIEDGTVEPASPSVEMTTEPRFGRAAVAVIRATRFRPARVGGRPVKVWVTLPIWFHGPAAPPVESAVTAPPA